MGTVLFLMILVSFIYWFIPGVIGGGITALALRSTNTRLDFAKVTTITLGWASGMFIGGITGRLVDMASLSYLKAMTYSQSAVSLIISLGITGMVTALIGGWSTYRALKSLVQVE